MVMYEMSDVQYQTVYNTLSFALASMMATTMYLWFRSTAVADKYKSAVLISGLVTFIAAYHYFRIFNSWVEAYSYSAGQIVNGALEINAPSLTGVPFNDAYRHKDWLLTVPLLLKEMLPVMKSDDSSFNAEAKALGVGSALKNQMRGCDSCEGPGLPACSPQSRRSCRNQHQYERKSFTTVIQPSGTGMDEHNLCVEMLKIASSRANIQKCPTEHATRLFLPMQC